MADDRPVRAARAQGGSCAGGPAARRLIGPGGNPVSQSAGQDCWPVFSTFCRAVLALFTVAVRLAPCISYFIMFGTI